MDCLCELGGGDLRIRFEDSSIKGIEQLLVNQSKETVTINGEVYGNA